MRRYHQVLPAGLRMYVSEFGRQMFKKLTSWSKGNTCGEGNVGQSCVKREKGESFACLVLPSTVH